MRWRRFLGRRPAWGWKLFSIGLFAATPWLAAFSATSDEDDSLDRDYSGALIRVPATEPSDALKAFEIEPGFRLQLAAAEPAVVDPVALDFDEHGRLFVVEMTGYSEDKEDRLGQIRLLEDADRDGLFEKSTIYAEGLSWPTAVICYDGGVFVGDAPDIFYFKDSDGDGRAEERRLAFTGFNVNNVQGLLNSFRWGVDNRIHVAVSSAGADLRRGDQPDVKPLVLRGRNFLFDPRTLDFAATSGASQHGMCFDSWGHLFTCSNSDHIQQVLIDDASLARNPYIHPPAVIRSIAAEGPAADVFRISPVEPWRIVRTRLRKKGLVPGPLEGGGRPAGYFTSATGVMIFTGDAWPEEFQGNAFIGDVGSNLVHRKVVETDPSAVPLVARRATPGKEFLASRDQWFRPVQFANGPDGNLYIADMYREVIEHPDSLPPIIKQHLDLTSGRDRGRIYRVVRADLSPQAERALFSRQLPGDATTDELVAMLAHENGWHRTTASRLLYERNDPTAVDALRRLAIDGDRPEGRLLALSAIRSLGRLDVKTLVKALNDSHPRVRQHALRLADGWLSSANRSESSEQVGELEAHLLTMTDDDDLSVRYQLALTLGSMAATDERAAALTALARRDVENEYVRTAILCSGGRQFGRLFRQVAANADVRKSHSGRAFLLELARQIGVAGDELQFREFGQEMSTLIDADQALAEESIMAALRATGPRSALGDVLHASTQGAAGKIIAERIERSLAEASDASLDPSRRAASIVMLSLSRLAQADPLATLTEALEPQQPQTVQSAALAVLSELGGPEPTDIVLAAWAQMGPSLRREATEMLLARTNSVQALLAAIEGEKFAMGDLDPAAVQRLTSHPDAAIRELADRLGLGKSVGKRTEVVEAYREALELTGDVDRGRAVFRANCAVCHRREGVGIEIGADLATVINQSPESVLISILDPNREVNPKFLQYTILTSDGLAISGIIGAETATSVTLVRAEKASDTVARADIETIESTGMTLMPEAFEKIIDKQAMSDLLAYLRNPQ